MNETINLDLVEGQDSEYRSVEIAPSSSVQLICNVDGQTHADPSLTWVRDGNIFQEIPETIVVEEIQENSKTSLNILQFDSTHAGEYECTVRRPKGKFQKAKIRLEVKPTSDYNHTAFGEIPCDAELSKICHNNGICYMHEESKSLSCRCPQNTYGNRCQYVGGDVEITVVNEAKGISTGTIAAGGVFSIFVLIGVLIFAFFCWKRTRANRAINREQDDFLETAHRASVKSNNSLNFAKNLEKKFHDAVERVNSGSPTRKNCQNCTLPYMRWSDSALSLARSNEQSTVKCQSFEQVSPKHTVVFWSDQNRPRVHELNCCRFADIV